MDGQLRGPAQPPGAFTEAAVTALRAIDATGRDPIVLGFHPTARLNPYHSLLYQRAWPAGIAALPIVREETIAELAELARLGYRTVLHLHWLNLVLGDARSPKEAHRDRLAFLDRLDRYRDAGGQLVWTVHNILPHGTRFEAEEAQLSADVVDRCDVVHTMAAGTPEFVAPWFRIPTAKILQIPHPSYIGAYEDRISREQARHELGIWPDEVVHILLGAIRPYKGLTQLFDAWDVVDADPVPRRLVIAGGPTDEPGVAEMLERAALHPSILLHATQVEPADVQIYMRAADVAILPHLRGLNSGALMLALTFGLPVVVPAGGGIAEVADERFARSFTVDDHDSLVAALRGADDLLTPEARAAALATAAERAPAIVSERFAEGLRVRLDADRADGTGRARRPGRSRARATAGARPATGPSAV